MQVDGQCFAAFFVLDRRQHDPVDQLADIFAPSSRIKKPPIPVKNQRLETGCGGRI